MAERNSFILYVDTKPQWDMLDDHQAATLIRALFAYVQNGEQLVTEDGMLAMAFSFMAQQIDRDSEKWTKRCKRNAESARKRWEAKQANESEPMQTDANASERIQTDANDADTDTDNDNDTVTDTDNESDTDMQASARTASHDPDADAESSASPTVEEVAAYCRKRGNGIDAKRFVEYYAAVGWMQGQTPIRDWRALVRKWETNPHSRDKPKIERSSISNSDLEQLMCAQAGGM